MALGDLAWPGYGKPDLDQIWCLRADLRNDAGYKATSAWDDKGSGARTDASFWEVVPTVPGKEPQYVPALAGTFRAGVGHGLPDSSLAGVPALLVPKKNVFLPATPPTIDPNAIPERGSTYSDMVTGSVTLPFTAFFPSSDRACLDRIVEPFCAVDKIVSWVLLDEWPNFQSTAQSYTFTALVGLKTSSSTTMEHSVGISITAEGDFKVGKFSTTLNYQFTISETHSREATQEQTASKTYTVPARTRALCWGRRVRINGIRADGTTIGGSVSYNTKDFYVTEVAVV